MAKKTTTKKPAKKKALKLVKPGGRAKVADKGRPKPVGRTPKSQGLPGLEQVRNHTLDRCAESIADCRATINNARQEEAGWIQTAIREMQKIAAELGQSTYAYKHAGVELLMVPGDVKLRVRALKDGGEGDEVGLPNAGPLVRALPDVDEVGYVLEEQAAMTNDVDDDGDDPEWADSDGEDVQDPVAF